MIYEKHKWVLKHCVDQKKWDTKIYLLYLCKVKEQAELIHDNGSQENGESVMCRDMFYILIWVVEIYI